MYERDEKDTEAPPPHDTPPNPYSRSTKPASMDSLAPPAGRVAVQTRRQRGVSTISREGRLFVSDCRGLT